MIRSRRAAATWGAESPCGLCLRRKSAGAEPRGASAEPAPTHRADTGIGARFRPAATGGRSRRRGSARAPPVGVSARTRSIRGRVRRPAGPRNRHPMLGPALRQLVGRLVQRVDRLRQVGPLREQRQDVRRQDRRSLRRIDRLHHRGRVRAESWPLHRDRRLLPSVAELPFRGRMHGEGRQVRRHRGQLPQALRVRRQVQVRRRGVRRQRGELPGIELVRSQRRVPAALRRRVHRGRCRLRGQLRLQEGRSVSRRRRQVREALNDRSRFDDQPEVSQDGGKARKRILGKKIQEILPCLPRFL